MADDQLAKSSRAYNFGQNANKLHARPEGSKSSKAWRAEVPATDDEKLTARQFVDDFSSKFRLDGVHMSAIVEQHVTMLEEKIHHGPKHLRSWFETRKKDALDAKRRYDSIKKVFNAEYAFPEGLSTFVSYVHDRPHGESERLKLPKVQGKPHAIGRVKGMRVARAPSMHVHLCWEVL